VGPGSKARAVSAAPRLLPEGEVLVERWEAPRSQVANISAPPGLSPAAATVLGNNDGSNVEFYLPRQTAAMLNSTIGQPQVLGPARAIVENPGQRPVSDIVKQFDTVRTAAEPVNTSSQSADFKVTSMSDISDVVAAEDAPPAIDAKTLELIRHANSAMRNEAEVCFGRMQQSQAELRASDERAQANEKRMQEEIAQLYRATEDRLDDKNAQYQQRVQHIEHLAEEKVHRIEVEADSANARSNEEFRQQVQANQQLANCDAALRNQFEQCIGERSKAHKNEIDWLQKVIHEQVKCAEEFKAQRDEARKGETDALDTIKKMTIDHAQQLKDDRANVENLVRDVKAEAMSKQRQESGEYYVHLLEEFKTQADEKVRAIEDAAAQHQVTQGIDVQTHENLKQKVVQLEKWRDSYLKIIAVLEETACPNCYPKPVPSEQVDSRFHCRQCNKNHGEEVWAEGPQWFSMDQDDSEHVQEQPYEGAHTASLGEPHNARAAPAASVAGGSRSEKRAATAASQSDRPRDAGGASKKTASGAPDGDDDDSSSSSSSDESSSDPPPARRSRRDADEDDDGGDERESPASKKEKKKKKRQKRKRSSSSSSSSSSVPRKEEKGSKDKDKELSKVEVRKMPNYAQLEAWKMALLDALVTTRNQPDSTPVIKWFNEVMSLSLEQLAECPKELRRLDQKLGSALNDILEGAIGKEITQKKRAYLKNNDKLMGGRQVLKLILLEFQLSGSMGRFYSTLDLEKLRWQGDSVSQMRSFRSTWDDIDANLNPAITEGEKLEVVLNRMEESTVLESKVDRFKEHKATSKKRTLKKLLEIIDDAVEKHREKDNRKKQDDLIRGLNDI